MTPAARLLIDASRAWSDLSDDEARQLALTFHERTVTAGDPVALPDAEAHEILFVAEGLLRFYYPSDDGRQSNKAFVGEGEFAGALAASALGVPLAYGIEALEDTRLLACDVTAWTALVESAPAFERLGRKLAEYILVRKERTARSLRLQSATERYATLVEERPDLVQRVPLYHLASYLGMSDVHLSRVRRQLAEAI
ncbi:MAG: Crp/Fnr family transcriptional regulator [Bacteroidota bacterium]